MQLVKAPRDLLLKPLSIVSGIVERRHTMPILANILVRKVGSRVSFVSTDVEVQITTHAEFGFGSDSVATTVAARKLLDILRALPESGEVSVSLNDKKMSIQSGKSRFALQTLDSEDFPEVKQPDAWSARLTLPQKQLKHLFNMVHFSMAQQDIRYYLNGMLLVLEDKNLRAVATDGHRLAYSSVDLEESVERQDVIVPRKTILEMLRLLDDSDEPVEVAFSSSQIRFVFGGVELISKLVEGKFPDYQRVIPQGYTKSFIITREAFQRTLQRVAILTTDKFKGVRMQMVANSLKVSASNAEQEEAYEELEIEFAHEPLDIGFNVSYLLDVLANLKTESIVCAVGDSNSSALITVPESQDFKYVVMPMRI